jgi:hypothetical protein
MNARGSNGGKEIPKIEAKDDFLVDMWTCVGDDRVALPKSMDGLMRRNVSEDATQDETL